MKKAIALSIFGLGVLSGTLIGLTMGKKPWRTKPTKEFKKRHGVEA